MNRYEITFHYRGQTETHVRKVMGHSAYEAEQWLRDTLWNLEYQAKSIVIERTDLTDQPEPLD